jgi:hypothetical protein
LTATSTLISILTLIGIGDVFCRHDSGGVENHLCHHTVESIFWGKIAYRHCNDGDRLRLDFLIDDVRAIDHENIVRNGSSLPHCG